MYDSPDYFMRDIKGEEKRVKNISPIFVIFWHHQVTEKNENRKY